MDLCIGFCKECGCDVYQSDEIPGYEGMFECRDCGHPHAKDELWVDKPYYIKGG